MFPVDNLLCSFVFTVVYTYIRKKLCMVSFTTSTVHVSYYFSLLYTKYIFCTHNVCTVIYWSKHKTTVLRNRITLLRIRNLLFNQTLSFTLMRVRTRTLPLIFFEIKTLQCSKMTLKGFHIFTLMRIWILTCLSLWCGSGFGSESSFLLLSWSGSSFPKWCGSGPATLVERQKRS